MRRRFFSFTLLAACLLALPATGAAKPNIVFILADDLGYGDVGAYNPDSKIPTPHLDGLAEEGRRFTDAHAPGSVCVPTRYGLLTGRYPLRNDRSWKKEPVIKKDRVTLASFLRDAGYQTTMVGKWHLGFEGGIRFEWDRPLRGGPVDRGFAAYFGMHASLDIPPYFYIQGDRPLAAPTNKADDRGPEADHWTRIQGPFRRAGGRSPGFHHEDVLPRWREEAVARIERWGRSKADRPLFLYLALTAPHTPWLPLPSYQGESGAGSYGDFVMQVDAVVGDVLAALDRVGAKENTLVVFTSDNGPVWYPKDTKRFGHSSTAHFRGMKGDAWEGGHRMPFLVRWPGHVPAGTSTDQTLSFTDMLATFAAVTGKDLPKGAGRDSVNMLPAMLGEAEEPLRRTTVHQATGTLALRMGKWKLIPTQGSGGFIGRPSARPPEDAPPGQLYNLEEDPGETNNLYEEKPDVVKRLKKELSRIKRGS